MIFRPVVATLLWLGLKVAFGRRTKMWFINLTRPLLFKIMLVIGGQVLAAVLGAVLKVATSED